MKKVLRILFHPVLLAIVGLLALAAVIWYFGPLVAFAQWRPLEPEWTRIALIAVVVLVYVGRKLWGVLKARRVNSEMLKDLLRPASVPHAEPSVSEQEVATLRNRFEEALGKLKKTRLGPQGRKAGWSDLLAPRQYLYQLPWYIFIGAPGSGKTTALINSGLQFPLAEALGTNAVQGVGGTRNCDWWFTDEAVLLDTAGRYATQDSNREVDAAAWHGFLQLLKKHRRRRPINGVMLTVSVADLLQQSPAEREAHAAALRARLNELHEQLGIRFPIYMLVTKCDLLAGFMEFFSELGKEERAQVWGTTFPYREETQATPNLAELGSEFTRLESRLNDRLIDRLQQERDPVRRALVYGFPQQFSAFKELLGGFLDQVFVASRFHVPPLLRGVYFTSGTQEGSPIDRVMGALARSLGLERKILPPHAASGRSYFLTRLLRDLVFTEQGLAGTNLKWERRRMLLQGVGYALTVLVTIGLVGAWVVSYRNNRAYVAEVESKVDSVNKHVQSLPLGASTDVAGLLPVLQSVRDLGAATGGTAGGTPAGMGFGLYQGDKLASAADNAYRRLLRDSFLPRIVYRVEEQLRTGGGPNSEMLYEGLKTYLMFHDPEHFDAGAVKGWVVLDWESNLPREVTVDQRAALTAHVDSLLERGAVTSPVPPDQALVRSLRATLARLSLPERIYNRLKIQGAGKEFPEFTAEKAVGPIALNVFVRSSGQPLTKGVPGFFSFDAYHRAFVTEYEKAALRLALEEEWVLGAADGTRPAGAPDPQRIARMAQEVRGLYFREYVIAWKTFVKDIQLIHPRNSQESVRLALALSTADSPLPRLMRAISRETTLGAKPEDEKSLIDKAGEKIRTTQDKIKTLSSSDKSLPPGAKPESIVDDAFSDIRRLVTSPSPGQPAPIDQVTEVLPKVHTLFTAIQIAQEKGAPSPPTDGVRTEVAALASALPEPLRVMLPQLVADGIRSFATGTCARLNSELVSVAEYCRQAITDRYPFVRSSSRDVTPDDFARLFGPGGLMDEFFNTKLAPIVDKSGRGWTFKKDNLCNPATLVQFQRAAMIRDVFFPGGTRVASLKLTFTPREMDSSIIQFTLDVDGQLVKYSHGPQVPQSVQWPGPRGSTQVRLEISPPSATGASSKTVQGPWALFRMVDAEKIEDVAQRELFRVAFNIEGRKAAFDVTANSVQNPFRLEELRTFQCPSGL